MTTARRIHRILGLVLLLPIPGWAGTAFLFFSEAGVRGRLRGAPRPVLSAGADLDPGFQPGWLSCALSGPSSVSIFSSGRRLGGSISTPGRWSRGRFRPRRISGGQSAMPSPDGRPATGRSSASSAAIPGRLRSGRRPARASRSISTGRPCRSARAGGTRGGSTRSIPHPLPAVDRRPMARPHRRRARGSGSWSCLRSSAFDSRFLADGDDAQTGLTDRLRARRRSRRRADRPGTALPRRRSRPPRN